MYAECPGHQLGRLALTLKIGLLLQYFISKPIQESTGRSVYYSLLIMYDLYDMKRMFMKFTEPLEKGAAHRKHISILQHL